MSKSNKKLGNEFENELAEILAENGFWVHLLNQNKSGQPADIIATKNRQSFLIDAKVCTDNKFKLDRIEENQHLAMQKWKNCGNGEGWFALKVASGTYMISHSVMKEVSETNTELKYIEIVAIGIELEKWMKWV